MDAPPGMLRESIHKKINGEGEKFKKKSFERLTANAIPTAECIQWPEVVICARIRVFSPFATVLSYVITPEVKLITVIKFLLPVRVYESSHPAASVNFDRGSLVTPGFSRVRSVLLGPWYFKGATDRHRQYGQLRSLKTNFVVDCCAIIYHQRLCDTRRCQCAL